MDPGLACNNAVIGEWDKPTCTYPASKLRVSLSGPDLEFALPRRIRSSASRARTLAVSTRAGLTSCAITASLQSGKGEICSTSFSIGLIFRKKSPNDPSVFVGNSYSSLRRDHQPFLLVRDPPAARIRLPRTSIHNRTSAVNEQHAQRRIAWL